MKRIYACFLFIFLLFFQAEGALAYDSSAVILAYHRVNEDGHKDTNIQSAQFERHIQAILNEGYSVLPLPELIRALKAREEMPDKTIAITFEGGFKSAQSHAFPLLLEHGIPFTVFFSSDHADVKTDQYMDWHDLQKLAQNDHVTFGILPARYARLSQNSRIDILAQINKARTKYRSHFKREPKLFSYPFGEYSKAYKSIIAQQGFDAAFGLQSGPVHSKEDFLSLPRFSMTQDYSSLERFYLITEAQPLFAYNVTPADPVTHISRPDIGFSLPPTIMNHYDDLGCFASGLGRLDLVRLSEERIKLALRDDLPEGRVRINCTMPVVENKETVAWRWFGMLLTKAH